ncbi:acyltransferase family protein [Clostridium saccharoperbutylacetonicum]|uniref:acyltransferase family protein n=1 Tax=Clostridium saccharoperbutylacetonicum TaxID=36745 RepID=UPI000983D41B|nr:acyltransferase family protein [Clostridium saccharoperbutylacetonicum]AQR97826.1 acyltransferase family protein [Clostridium saccharoperbutylacetonicum]NSB33716.1 peptidoglycan/LPS O-acetylase OafA/YrhL [Clostridium saccharoperbutylacetonicum]
MFFLCIILLILVSLLLNTKISSEKRMNFFDKDSTDALRGICAIFIILNHYGQHTFGEAYQSLAGRIFMFSGSCSVGFFFLISGYANYLSYYKNGNKKLHWLIKVLKIFATVETINIIENFLFSQTWTISKFNIFNTGYWFIIVLMALYVVLYIDLKWFDKYSIVVLWGITLIYILILRRFNISHTWYNSIACFSLGVTVAKHKEMLFNILEKINSKLIMILLAPIVSYMYYMTITYEAPKYNVIVALVFNIFVILYLYEFNFHFKLWSLLGGLSLELFIWHERMLIQVLQKEQTSVDLTQFVIILTMTVTLSLLVKWIINSSTVRIRNRFTLVKAD